MRTSGSTRSSCRGTGTMRRPPVSVVTWCHLSHSSWDDGGTRRRLFADKRVAGIKKSRMETMGVEARDQIEQWRAETADKPLQSAQQVQDRLLDLYATLRAYPVIGE